MNVCQGLTPELRVVADAAEGDRAAAHGWPKRRDRPRLRGTSQSLCPSTFGPCQWIENQRHINYTEVQLRAPRAILLAYTLARG